MSRPHPPPNVPETRIRRATAADAADIARLHIASWRSAYTAELPAHYLDALDEAKRTEDWRVRLARPATEVILAEGHAAVVLGFCAHGASAASTESLTIWEIYGLHVDPALRGMGIGSRLFSEACDTGRARGATALTLWVVSTNAPARGFYESKGMQPDGGEKRRELARDIFLHEVRYRMQV